jgi:hypothetical protein
MKYYKGADKLTEQLSINVSEKMLEQIDTFSQRLDLTKNGVIVLLLLKGIDFYIKHGYNEMVNDKRRKDCK